MIRPLGKSGWEHISRSMVLYVGVAGMLWCDSSQVGIPTEKVQWVDSCHQPPYTDSIPHNYLLSDYPLQLNDLAEPWKRK